MKITRLKLRLPHPLSAGERIVLRGFLMLLLTLLPAPFSMASAAAEVAASTQQPSTRWRALAAPPQPGLPPVEVQLGYPGPYVATESSPIELRARSGGAPFDGYIGFHVAVGEKKTVDVPVISRAVVAPGATWTFTNWIRVISGERMPVGRFTTRELIIEWRDRNMKVIAERSVGVPPWSEQRPLRVTAPNEAGVDPTYLENQAVLLSARDLPAQTQWYAGFSAVILPLAVWLELPAPVKEAIFHAPIVVHLFGVPERVPQLTPLDRALMPIEFRQTARTLTIPWPYDVAGATERALPVSWHPKRGTRSVGAATSPYLTISGAAVHAADDAAFRRRLPRGAHPVSEHVPAPARYLRPTAAEVLREYRPALALAVLSVLSLSTWFIFRRRTHWAVLAAALVLAIVTIGARDRIRPAAGSHVFEEVRLLTPEVSEIITARRDYGAVPLRVSSPQVAGAVTRAGLRPGRFVEVRNSATSPGFGELHASGSWDSSLRRTTRRELGSRASVTILSADADRLRVRYESSVPINSVEGNWIVEGKRYFGTAHVTTSTRGEATIDARTLWRAVEYQPFQRVGASDTAVTLISTDQDRMIVISADHPRAELASATPYRILGALNRTGDGLTGLLALPAAIPPQAIVRARFFTATNTELNGVIAVRLTGAAGSFRVERPHRREPRLSIPTEELRRIAPAGGIVEVQVETQGLPADVTERAFSLRVEEKK